MPSRTEPSPEPGSLVSVVLPVYNGSGLIVDTLNSVLGQTHTNIEVLVVDDGSTDGSAEVVRNAFGSDPRVRILHQRNRGVAHARNYGMDETAGPFIAFIDADDLWREDKLAKQVARLLQAGPDVAVVYTWYANIDQEGVVISPLRPKPVFRGDVLVPLLLQNFLGNASTALMRSSAVKRVGGYGAELLERSGGQGFEDWHLFLKLAESYDFEVVEEFLTGYRQVAGSMSRNIKPFLANFHEARQDIWSRHPELPRALSVWSELYLLSWMIDRARSDEMRTTALRLYGRAALVVLRNDPLLPFRKPTRSFSRYVRELRRHQGDAAPTSFLDTELAVDLEAWQTVLELRLAFLKELME